jgi:hypothetical protein
MSIRAESLEMPGAGEPDELVFARLRAEAQALMPVHATYNDNEWVHVVAPNASTFVSRDHVVKRLPAHELELKQPDEENIEILFVSRALSEADFRQVTHIINLGKDMEGSTHIASEQEFEFSFGKSHMAGLPEFFARTVDRNEVMGLKGVLDTILQAQARKETRLRRAARWLLGR